MVQLNDHILSTSKYLPNTDNLMDTTESFEDHEAGVLDEFLQTSDQEKVGQQNRLALI